MYLETSDPCTLHFRHFFDELHEEMVTECHIHHGQCRVKGCGRGEMGVGAAFCSQKDMFIKRVGRRIALTRAVRGLPRPVRGEIWQKYFELAPRSKG